MTSCAAIVQCRDPGSHSSSVITRPRFHNNIHRIAWLSLTVVPDHLMPNPTLPHSLRLRIGRYRPVRATVSASERRARCHPPTGIRWRFSPRDRAGSRPSPPSKSNRKSHKSLRWEHSNFGSEPVVSHAADSSVD